MNRGPSPLRRIAAPTLVGLSFFTILTARSAAGDDEPATPNAQDARPPINVVFYLIDTCRADSLSAYGYGRKTTPFMEKIGAEGVVFEQCVSQGPWTKPSMAALLLSMYSSTTGIHSLFQQLSSKYTTFPEVFRNADYYTAGFSANPIMGRMSNYSQGFRYFREATQNIPNGDPIGHSSGSSTLLNDNVFAWMESRADKDYMRGERPLFLYIHSVDPHEEYEPAPQYLRRFADPAGQADYRTKRKLILSGVKRRRGAADLYRTQKHFDKAGVEVAPYIDYQKRLYDADIAANDDQIERLFERLEEEGLLENTLVVITADHGDEFMEHGGTSHGFSLYDELIRVPLILWGPGIVPAGLRVEHPVQSIDIYPTLCELAGLEAPDAVQGQSLVSYLRGEEPDAVRPVYSEKREPTADTGILLGKGNAVALIEYPWKYVRNFTQPKDRILPERELFDLLDDPMETENLVERHSDLVRRYDAMVESWLAGNLTRAGNPEVTRLTEIPEDTQELLRKLGYIK